MKTTTKTAPVHTLEKDSVPLNQLGFDFDGVIADTATTFLKIAKSQYGYNSFSKEDITNFELEECINMPKDVVERIFTDILTDSLGTGLQPMEGAVATLSQFARHERLTIITARPIDQPVHDWLETYFDKSLLSNINVVATGDHNDKIRHIHANGIQFFVDDRVATCQSLVTENICPIVYNQPWNAGRHNLTTVSDWDDISTLVTLPR
ncbi:5' nucleotidase, NT5C type [Desulforhopalus sp. 52FAK]